MRARRSFYNIILLFRPMSSDQTEATTATATTENSAVVSSRRRALADRVTFSSIDKNRIGSVRVLNSTLFPVKYKEQFYRDILLPEVEEFCKLGPRLLNIFDLYVIVDNAVFSSSLRGQHPRRDDLLPLRGQGR